MRLSLILKKYSKAVSVPNHGIVRSKHWNCVYQAMDKKMRKFLTNSIEQIEKELDLFQTK
jgi:hypothetical protein